MQKQLAAYIWYFLKTRKLTFLAQPDSIYHSSYIEKGT